MTYAFEIVIDAHAPAQLARFWAAALPGYAVRAYDEAEIKRLAALGLTPESDTSVALDGAGPTLWFQRCDGRATERNRLHLDLRPHDRDAETRRLCTLGAQVRDEHDSHTVLLDPEGNQFCLLDKHPK